MIDQSANTVHARIQTGSTRGLTFKQIWQNAELIRERREAIAERKSTNQEVLAIEGVASILHCSVQAVRNISDELLPKLTGPGKRKLYLKKDIIAYLEQNQETSPALDEILDEIDSEELDSKVDSGKRHSRNKESGND